MPRPRSTLPRVSRANNLLVEVSTRLSALSAGLEGAEWPDPYWRDRPVEFCETILGVELWEFQIKLIEAIRDHRHVACAGGRKIGKDFVVACAALWWYASRPKGRVFTLAPTSKQLDGISYLEIKQRMADTGICLACKRAGAETRPCPHSKVLTGDTSELAKNGIKSNDGTYRFISGQTAVASGGLRGFSGAEILYIEDEAAEVKEAFHDVMLGNLAGARCHIVMIGNPTNTSGHFFQAFHEQREMHYCIQQSSEETPNVLEGREVYPGLADRTWILEREFAWGRGSVIWITDVEGKFPTAKEGQVFSFERVRKAEEAWEVTTPIGRLWIGIDVAGVSGGGDEAAFAARRGLKCVQLYAKRLGSYEAYLIETLGLITTHQGPGEERPCVVVDRGGEEGAKVWGIFAAYHDEHPDAFDLVGVFSSDRARRNPRAYDRVRDELVASLADWIRDGGAIPTDLKLAGDMTSYRWEPNPTGRSKLEDKLEIRKRLGRSPDRADALALSTWEPIYDPATADAPAQERTEAKGVGVDPYELAASEERFDPYSSDFQPRGGGSEDD